jgi:hypothetical protein
VRCQLIWHETRKGRCSPRMCNGSGEMAKSSGGGAALATRAGKTESREVERGDDVVWGRGKTQRG